MAAVGAGRRLAGTMLALACLGLAGCGEDGSGDSSQVTSSSSAGSGGTGGTGACLPAEAPQPDGSCVAAGVPPEECAVGFEPDDEGGCRPVLPEGPCPAGQIAIPGESRCRELMDCGAAPWGNIPIEANTVFVDASFAGAGADGSQAKPFPGVQQAIDVADEDAIVAIAAGSYQEDLDIAGKRVRISGRCPIMVEIAGAGEVGTVVVAGGADGTAIDGLAVRGPNYGVIVSGSEDVVLSRVWVHDTGERGIDAEDTFGPTSLRIEDSLIERAADASVMSLSSRVAMLRSVARDASVHPSTGLARGVVLNVAQGSEVPTEGTVESSVIEATRDNGIYVRGSNATVEGTVVRDVQPNASDGLFGRGIAVEYGADEADRSNLIVRGSVVQRCHAEGIFVVASDATVETTVVRDVEPEEGGAGGIGINAQDVEGLGVRANVTVQKSVVANTFAMGISSVGSAVVVESTIVRDVHTAADGTGYGRAIGLEPGLEGNPCDGSAVRWSLIERVLDHGILVACKDTPVEGVLVRDVAPDALDGRFGRGIVVQSSPGLRASMTLVGSLVERVHDVGVGVLRADGVVESTTVRDVAPRASDQAGGRGVNVQLDLETQDPSTLVCRDTVVERVRDIGIAVIGGSAVIERTTVREVAPRNDGAFGDGVAVVWAEASIADSHVERAARAGVVSFGSDVMLAGSALECNQIDLDRETLVAVEGSFVDQGGNVCGCDGERVACQAVTSSLAAPDAL